MIKTFQKWNKGKVTIQNKISKIIIKQSIHKGEASSTTKASEENKEKPNVQ